MFNHNPHCRLASRTRRDVETNTGTQIEGETNSATDEIPASGPAAGPDARDFTRPISVRSCRDESGREYRGFVKDEQDYPVRLFPANLKIDDLARRSRNSSWRLRQRDIQPHPIGRSPRYQRATLPFPQLHQSVA